MPRNACRAVAAVVAVLVLSGCSVFGGDGGSGESAEAGTDPVAVPSLPVAADGTIEGAIATITRPHKGYEVTVDILSLKRYDKALRLEFAVTPRSRGEKYAMSGSFFGNSSAGAVTLLDTENLRQYPVLRVDDDTCVCSADLSGFELDQPTALFADYPVPPAGVTSLTVVLPNLGPVPDVAIS